MSIIKRLFDLILTVPGFLLIMPFLLIISLLIWKRDRHNPLFSQDRVGKNGKLFKCFKFRTMVYGAEDIIKDWERTNHPYWQEYVANNFKLRNDPRITKTGAFLRKTSLDELPQLINVLKGEMSLVGPRPILPREIPEYGEHISDYHQHLPGITGLWQVSGRSHTSFKDRVHHDVWYNKHWSLWLDIRILFKTFKVVFRKNEGAY